MVRGWPGEHWVPTGNTLLDGARVLGHDAHYDRMLALARLGILPLFLLACADGVPVGQSHGRAAGGADRDLPVHHDSAGAGARGAGDHGHGGHRIHRCGGLRGPAVGGTAGPAAHGGAGRRGGPGDDRQVLPAGVSAGDLCGDVSVSMARNARHPRTVARALAPGDGCGGDRVPGDLGRIPLFVRAAEFCPRVAAGAAILRRAERCLGSQRERARVVHSRRAAPFRRVVFLPGDAGREDATGDAAAGWLVVVDGVAQAAENRRAAGVLRGHPRPSR